MFLVGNMHPLRHIGQLSKGFPANFSIKSIILKPSKGFGIFSGLIKKLGKIAICTFNLICFFCYIFLIIIIILI